MNRNQAKDSAKSKITDYLKSKGIKNLNNNFSCLNPHHLDKNPSMSYDKNRQKVHCFSCNADYDIFDLISTQYGLSDDKEIFNKTYEWCGITLDITNKTYFPLQEKYNITQDTEIKTQETDQDYLAFFKLAQSNISDADFKNYISKRGISESIAQEYGLGYIKDWRSPKALKENKNPPATPRVIIPTSTYSYVARDTRDAPLTSKRDFAKMKEGSVNIFNIMALEKTESCFITEGEFDALSFLELGYNALSLGSSANTRLFLTKLKTASICCPFILAFDADDAGIKATIEIQEGLKELGATFFTAEILKSLTEDNTPKFTSQLYKNYKDANEFLVKDRGGFKKEIDKFLYRLNDQISIDIQAKLEEDEIQRQEYLQKSAFNHVQAFRESIMLNRDQELIATGFNTLDVALDGGLFEGLYVIGAISSLGKTTLAIQIADYVASQGRDVLYISLEMSRYEIMAKSISRQTLLYCKENGLDQKNLPKTTRGITVGKRYNNYTPKEEEIIYVSGENYKKYAKNLFIIEGLGDIGVKKIKSAVEEHQKYTKSIPIVIIDYLQILSPDNDRSTDKQNIDKAVLELKRISRDFKTPVLAISSLNRQSYKDPVTMEAFKESGAIEYSSDVLIGLQLKGSGGANFDVDNAKKQNPREVELKILKNRNGITGQTLDFCYHPKFNLFKELSTSVS